MSLMPSESEVAASFHLQSKKQSNERHIITKMRTEESDLTN